MIKKILLSITFIFMVFLISCGNDTKISMDAMEPFYPQNCITSNDNACVENSGSIADEEYNKIVENGFIKASETQLSSFSLDSSTYAYSNLRRLINNGNEITKDAVVIEQMLNYFNYSYENNTDNSLATILELGKCPWNSNNYLASIAVKAKNYEIKEQANNFVFLIDVSGSMKYDNKLSLFQQSFKLLMDEIGENDTISIVTYASGVKTIADGIKGDRKGELVEAVMALTAGGSTNGSGGIKGAYELALKHFIKGGNNRVLIATDGDFNVGLTGDNLIDYIKAKKDNGVYLSIFGFGIGNTKHNMMESLATNGNGTAYYIDSLLEAKRVFVEEMGGTMLIVAKDTKIQIDFNPRAVSEYRLIGYENKLLTEEQFNDSNTDAGEIGTGHTTIALYEIVPTKEFTNQDYIYKSILRYKNPTTDENIEVINSITNEIIISNDDFIFTSCVAEFGMMLRESEYKAQANYDNILARLYGLSLDDDYYKKEFLELVTKISDK